MLFENVCRYVCLSMKICWESPYFDVFVIKIMKALFHYFDNNVMTTTEIAD